MIHQLYIVLKRNMYCHKQKSWRRSSIPSTNELRRCLAVTFTHLCACEDRLEASPPLVVLVRLAPATVNTKVNSTNSTVDINGRASLLHYYT